MTDERINLPGLKSVTATSTSNPLWYLFAAVSGIIGFFTMLRHIPAEMSAVTAVMIFIVLPFGVPVGLVAFLTWYTDWQTDDRGLTKTRFGHDRTLSWSEVESARLLRNRATELIAGTRRFVVPGGDLTLSASVWQHLREKKGFELPERIASIWDAPLAGLPEEFVWENPRRIGFLAVHSWQVISVVIALAYLGLIFFKRDKMPEERLDQYFMPFPWIMFAFLGRRAIARRITVGPEGLSVEPARFQVRQTWDHVSAVRVGRKSVVLGLVQETVIPITAGDRNLPVLLEVMRKHLREQTRPVLFVIPPELRDSVPQQPRVP